MVGRITRDFQGVSVITEDWPVIVVDFPEARVPDAALKDSLFHLEELMKTANQRHERTYTITDMTRMTEFPPSSQRQYAAAWTSRTLPLQKAATVGAAMVIRGTMLRALINAVHWIAPPGMPSAFVATRREAFAEAIAAFEAAHMP